MLRSGFLLFGALFSVLSGVLFGAGLLLAPSGARAGETGRIVAISDVHGAYDAMVRTLGNAGILDPRTAWAGGTARLVVNGDLLDRGPDSRAAMDLLMRLEDEARAAGGAVYVLLGNHEVMNLMGDLRYVSAGEYAAFAPDETAGERQAAFEAWVGRHHPEAPPASVRAAFDAAYPPGYFAHRRAFAADGVYGAWLLSKPVILVLERTAFVHGGLSPMIGRYGIDGVNGLVEDLATYVRALGDLREAGVLLPTDALDDYAQPVGRQTAVAKPVHDALAAITAFSDSDLNAADGPLWYRGNVYCGELVEQDRLDAVLDALGADRVVIGHTPTPGRSILERIDGQVLEVDTGMLSSHYGGSGHALILDGGATRVVSESSTESLAPAAHPRRVGPRPAALPTAESLEAFLRHGEVGAPTEDSQGRSVVTVRDGDVEVQAVFRPRASRANDPEVAAYRLDRLLELDMVPVTVVREVGGEPGSLQYLPPGVVDEEQRATARQGHGAFCPLEDQLKAMYVFDSLIYNEGRTRSRILYSPDSWQLLLVGHGDAFPARKGRPRYLEQAPVVIGDAWREALASLDEKSLQAELGDVLNERLRRALLARRDGLLAGD